MLAALAGCSLPDRRLDPMTFVQEYNESRILRLNGCYYASDSTADYSRVLIFYVNGTLLDLGAFDDLQLDSIKKLQVIPRAHNIVKQLQLPWGLYLATDDSIKTELYYPVGSSYKPGIQSGFIINDTTFTMTLLINSDGTDPIISNETFHFLQLKAKPDSTNNFIPSK
jgi:hypothetical protein